MGVTRSNIISSLDLNNGALAGCYISMPLGYYKEVTYPYFAEILDLLGSDIRVLNIGAGCGHFEIDYFSTRPHSKTRFALFDSSYELLKYANDRLSSCGIKIETIHGSYNSDDWFKNLGQFDAIISHNSLFHLEPDRLSQFYATCYSLLRGDGVLLNQQSFSPTVLKSHFKSFYAVLGPGRFMSSEERERLAKLEKATQDIEMTNQDSCKAEAEALLAKGWALDGPTPFASLDLTLEQHLTLMNSANFTAACLWRMMHFGLICGLKGKPFEAQTPR